MDFEGIYQSYCKDVFRYLRSLGRPGRTWPRRSPRRPLLRPSRPLTSSKGTRHRAWLFTIANTRTIPLQAGEADHGGGISPVHPRTGETSGGTDHRPGASLSGPPVSARDAGAVQGGVYPAGVWELPFEKIGLLFGKTPSWARVTFYRAKKQIIEYMEGIENEHHPL